jgi:ribonuclease VapC
MVVDTSALVAILAGEPEQERFIRILSEAPIRRISGASLFEAGMVLIGRRMYEPETRIQAFLEDSGIQVFAFDEGPVALAIAAFGKFGKGLHPASLNFGDCMTYPLAKQTGEPLLFKGNDFNQTDLLLA